MSKKFNHKEVWEYTKNVFLAIGSSEEHAEMAANILISAELRNIPSHGVIRLTDYVRLWEEKRLNATPNIKIEHETPSTALINGDRGAGLVVGQIAMQTAIDKAKQVGTGWVAVNNSNHYGIAGYHAMMALEHDMIGLTMTNANPSVAPTYSVERLLGTNPIAMVVPAKNQPPVVIDMATSPVARGKIVIAMRKGEKLPFGFVQDKHGNPSTDPNVLKDDGALVPLGCDSVHGSHKGYCMGAMVDILSGVLPGASFGPWVPPIAGYQKVMDDMPGVGTGHFFGAMRIDAFQKPDAFKEKMDIWINRFRASETMPGEDKVVIPGDPEREYEAIYSKEGIPLIDQVVSDLQVLADKLKIDYKIKEL
jgi:L-2-hydroxycarboxylate dehydrogenase (NAD+)